MKLWISFIIFSYMKPLTLFEIVDGYFFPTMNSMSVQ